MQEKGGISEISEIPLFTCILTAFNGSQYI